jgi:arylsulfatase A-like enzyme
VEEQARRELSGYYAHIEATDRALAPLLSHPALANTIIVFTSVHGDMHGAHGLFRKGWPHEESVRIPLILRLPRSLRRFQLAVTSADLVSLLDLHHWTRRWAGNPAPDTPPPGPRPRQLCSMPSVVALPHQCDRTWTAVRTETHKLVLNEDGSPWLFFDLVSDPLEKTNLVDAPASAPLISALRSAINGN